MQENKRKYAFWMRPSMISEIERALPETNHTSKSEFVCRAVETYLAFLRSGSQLEFLFPMLAEAIKNQVESVEHDLSEMLFKLAVEQSVSNHLTAVAMNIRPGDVEQVRQICAETVAQTNGIMDLKSAAEFQDTGKRSSPPPDDFENDILDEPPDYYDDPEVM